MSFAGIPGAVLRPARDTDCTALARLARSAHSHPWTEKQYRHSLQAGHGCWLLTGDGGEVIACCVMSQLFDEAEILDVAVAPAWRRRGVARALLRRVVAELPDDIVRVLLDVRSSNWPARTLYRSLGFTEDGVRRNYYPAEQGAREDAVLMSLLLPHHL